MRRFWLLVVFSLVATLGAAGVAGAGKFHFKSLEFSGGSLVFNGVAVGLGNGEYQFDLEATANVLAICQNKGGNQAPGQTLPVSLSNSTTATTDSSGRAPVSIVIEDPTIDDFAGVSSKEAGCSNGNWSLIDVTFVEWTSAHLVVTDLGTGAIVYDALFNCSGSGATLSCVAAA